MSVVIHKIFQLCPEAEDRFVVYATLDVNVAMEKLKEAWEEAPHGHEVFMESSFYLEGDVEDQLEGFE